TNTPRRPRGRKSHEVVEDRKEDENIEASEKAMLKEVVLPKSLKKLQSLAFSCCSELKTVTFKGKPEELGSSIFDRCDSLEEIFVPSGTKEYFVQALLSVDERIVIEY
ncbi:MAG: leucine-rich repeat protein, partial [Prevotella sp.]